jgi:hypothetical protein
MNYNTEVINSVAQQLAEIIKEAVVEQQKAGQGTPRDCSNRGRPARNLEANWSASFGNVFEFDANDPKQ